MPFRQHQDWAQGDGQRCRHHAACMDVLAGELGIDGGWRNGGAGDIRHAWNEYPVDTNGDGVDDSVLIVDSYNEIIMRCPTGK